MQTSQSSQRDIEVNSYVETYLDYYCELSHAPGFAILLKGQWGSGKTWFINRYCERLKENGKQHLYISLYGMSAISEIEDKFFQLLHPILSSKGMAITGVIVKGLLKGALKIDLNSDNKEDGTWNIQIPEINLPKHLENINKSVLIFDDLERCNIDIGNLLGYINYFVEHQELKVILVANEDELHKNIIYQSIKEKLIGRTFGISPNFEGALENFITQTDNTTIRSFLSESSVLIKDLYDKAEYENLRNLKQIILDFQRIFEALPDKAKANPEILKDLLKLLVVFSVEIKRGSIFAKDIGKLQEEYTSALSKRVVSRQTGSSATQGQEEDQTSLQKILDRYSFLDLHQPFPSAAWWQIFFDRGTIDIKELEQSILSSKYFQDENTPDWIKLWHFSDLSDDDFDVLLKKIETEFNSRDFHDLGVIKHIFGLFLMFSDAGIYNKTKQEILEDSKKYIDELKSNGRLETLPYSVPLSTAAIGHMFGSYLNLGFQGKEFAEFKEFCDYIDETQRLSKIEKMPEAAQTVLDAMQTDVWKFHRMICLDGSHGENASEPKYHETPILSYVSSNDFIEKLLALTHEDQQYIFWAIKDRYKYENINNKFLEELDWLRSVETLLLEEADRRKGKLSGFCLRLLDTHYLKGVIEKLEVKRREVTK